MYHVYVKYYLIKIQAVKVCLYVEVKADKHFIISCLHISLGHASEDDDNSKIVTIFSSPSWGTLNKLIWREKFKMTFIFAIHLLSANRNRTGLYINLEISSSYRPFLTNLFSKFGVEFVPHGKQNCI